MSPQLPEPSGLLVYGFLTIQLTMAVGLLYCIVLSSGTKALPKAVALLVAWLGLTAGLASTGMLDTWAPPPMLLILFSMVGFLAWSSRQPWTAKLAELPLPFLVGFQGFRIVVEMLIHIAVQEGIAHPTMTWSGTNWDIVAGVTAVLLAPFAKRLEYRVLQIWNVSMAILLIVTVVTAVLAAPTPFRQIMGEPANTWVTHFPFIWLPTILVFCAWLGHIVLFRKLAN